jgi:solute carrier family 40 (iron-regulated transporter), member 1
MSPRLQRDIIPTTYEQTLQPTAFDHRQTQPGTESALSISHSFAHRVFPISSVPFYLRHPVLLPSFSLSLLYLTVLSFSGQMVTYLLSVGYTSLHVGLARLGSSVFELSATWIAPRLMKRIGVVRSGIWSLSWQMIWLAATVSWFFAGFHDTGGTDTNSFATATGLAVGVAISRVGLWSYDICAQTLIQNVSSETSSV